MVNVLTYATDDFTRWGAGKGAPLTAHEHDESHYNLDRRLDDLETNPPTAISIASVTSNGSQLTFHLSNGDTLGPITLPVAVFQERGSWRAGRDYHRLDTVRVGGFGRYLILKDHHSEAPFDPDRQIAGGNVYYLLEESGTIFGAVDIEDSRDMTEDDIFRFTDVVGNSVGDPVDITVQEESTDFPWNIGDRARFRTNGVSLTIVAAGAVVLQHCDDRSLTSRTPNFAIVELIYRGSDVWMVTGDLELVTI